MNEGLQPGSPEYTSIYPEIPPDEYKEKLQVRASTFKTKKILSRRYLVFLKGNSSSKKQIQHLRINNLNDRSIKYEVLY